MKKEFIKLWALVLSICLLGLTCCQGQSPSAQTGSMTLVLAGEEISEYTVELDGLDLSSGLISVLEKLKSENKLDYEMKADMLERVGNVKNDFTKGEYIYVYTSVMEDFDVSQYVETVEYKGQTLTSSGVGVDKMSIEPGAVIYIGTIKW